MYTRTEAGVGAAGEAAEQGDRKYELLRGTAGNGGHLLFLDKNITEPLSKILSCPYLSRKV